MVSRRAPGAKCPDGHPHYWLIGDPVYGWHEGRYTEVTRWECARCPAKRTNYCPLVAEVWVGSENSPVPHLSIVE